MKRTGRRSIRVNLRSVQGGHELAANVRTHPEVRDGILDFGKVLHDSTFLIRSH